MSDSTKAKRRSERRPAAEWATYIVSIVVVVGLLALLSLQFGRDGDVRIEVTPRTSEVSEVGGLYYLPLEIANRGERTVLNIVVGVTSGDENVELEIDILAGGGADDVVAVFRSRPGSVEARVLSFKVP